MWRSYSWTSYCYDAKQAQDTNYKDFIAWIFNKKEVKNEVSVALRAILQAKDNYIENMLTPLREMIAQSLPDGSASSVASVMASEEDD